MAEGIEVSSRQRRYRPFGRPFRRQVTAEAAAGFEGYASRGRCQCKGCSLWEWRNGARFCREHWLVVYQEDRLPERWGVG